MRWVLLFAVLVLIAWLSLSVYRGRLRAPSRPWRAVPLAPFPAPPLELTGPNGAALLPETGVLYLGTAMAGDWNDPVTVGDVSVQTPATLHVSRSGLLVDRAGATPLWVPARSVRGVRLGRSLSGRVQADGILVVTWQLGGHLLDIGFRGDEAVYPEWMRTLRSLADNARGRGST